jgi:membrane-bound hydrogenase subunit beta
MNPETLLGSFRAALGNRLLEDRAIERSEGNIAPRLVYDLWVVVDRGAFHDAVAHLCANYNPHLSVISGEDLGNGIALNYHFSTGWGERYGEATCTIRTVVPKSDLAIPTITDLLPGAQTSEREKREFFGIDVVGIPDPRNLFLPEDLTIHPWRKDLDDETKPFVKRLVKWEGRDE